MRLTHLLSLPTGWKRRLGRIALPLLACLAAGCAPAGASGSIDESLLRIEQVAPRLSSALSAVENVTKAAAERGNSNASEAETLLETAVEASFDTDAMGAEILKAVEQVDGETIDAEAFANATAAFEEGRAKIAEVYEAQDRTAAKDIEARLADAERGPRIRQLTELMAAPELAVETAITSQVMYAAIEAFSNPGTTELASASEEQRRSETQNVIAALRSKTENEKPVPKDVARLDEQARLSFILATLSSEDLTILLDFYQSSGGKAKRQALVDSYTRETDQANARVLERYFSALEEYFKTHPRPQQQ